jgi:O-antigen/teichoic acid export membrane protein
MRERSTIGADSIRTLAFNIAQSGFAVLTGIAVAKALGPAGKGEYALLQLLQAAAAAVTGNLGMAITYEIARRQKPLYELVRPLGLLLAALSVVEWAAVGIWVWGHGTDPAPLLFAVAAPALIVLSWQGPIFLGLGWIRSLNVQGLYFAAGTFVTAVLTLYVFHSGTIGAMWGWVACVWAIAVSILVRTRGESRGVPTEPTGTIVRDLLGFGLRASAGGIFGFINNKIDSIAILAWLGTSGFGIYTVAVSAGELLFKVSRSVAQAATLRVAASERAIAARTVAKSNRASFAIILAASAVAFVAAPWAVDLLYGVRFHQAGDAIRILLPGIAAVSSSGILSTFFSYQMGRPIFLLYMSIMNAVVETTLCFVLVPRLQIDGAALACTLTYLNAAVVMTWYFCKHSDLTPADLWIPTFADVRTVMRAFRPNKKSIAAALSRDALDAGPSPSQDFVICGWTSSDGDENRLGALLLGVFDRGRLIYAGLADAGNDQRMLDELRDAVAPLEATRCPFRLVPFINAPIHWVQPTLVAAVTFEEFTSDGALRQPVYLQLRAEKRPEACVRTEPAGSPENA